jgi:hypothetical protein
LAVLAIGTAWSRGIIRVLPPLVRRFCIIVGAGGLLATLLTRFETDLAPAPRMAREPAM